MSQNPPSRCAPSIAAPLDLLIEMTCTRERVMIDSALLAALSDTDGSESLTTFILGVPDGALLSAGARQPDGSWLWAVDRPVISRPSR